MFSDTNFSQFSSLWFDTDELNNITSLVKRELRNTFELDTVEFYEHEHLITDLVSEYDGIVDFIK